jgi:hypothetical protein
MLRCWFLVWLTTGPWWWKECSSETLIDLHRCYIPENRNLHSRCENLNTTKRYTQQVGFEVLIAMVMKSSVRWNSRDVSEEHDAYVFRVEALLATRFMLVACSVYSSTLITQAIYRFRHFGWLSTDCRRYIPEERTLHYTYVCSESRPPPLRTAWVLLSPGHLHLVQLEYFWVTDHMTLKYWLLARIITKLISNSAAHSPILAKLLSLSSSKEILRLFMRPGDWPCPQSELLQIRNMYLAKFS